MSLQPSQDTIPPDVQAALLRGDRVEAFKMLRDKLQDPNDPALPLVAAALGRGDQQEAVRLLREALERSVGRPMASASNAPAAMPQGEEIMAPGQVAPSSTSSALWWIVAAAVIAVGIYLVRHWR